MALSKDRDGRLTASSHAIPLGHGFKSPQAYWREWHGIDTHDERTLERFQYGHDHEADAVAAYESIMGDIVENALDRQEFIAWEDWSGCTPDGRTQWGILECKAPSRLWDEPSLGYYIQVQSQLVMTDEGVADLCAWTPDQTRIWRTRKSPDYWSLVESILKRYYNSLVAGLEPKRGEFKKIPLEATWERIA